MTNKFEEWLENRISFAAKQTKEELGLPYFHSVSGRKKAFEDALSQYHEFLKEQTQSFKMIRKEDYKDEPVQYVGYYILHCKDLNLPEPEVFFVEVLK